jgi:hypothetical protein
MASVFVAQAAETTIGFHRAFGAQLTMILTLMITSKGVAAVPRAAAIERARKKRRAIKHRAEGFRHRAERIQLRGDQYSISDELEAVIQGRRRMAIRSKQLPMLDLFWDVANLTTRDASTFLQAIEHSLNETAVEALLSEGVPETSLNPYKEGKRLLDIILTDAEVGSWKISIKIDYSSDAKKEPWLKSVAKGVLKKIAIIWISSLVAFGPHQGGGSGGGAADPGHPGSKSVPALVASLAQTGKVSTLSVSGEGAKPSQIQIDVGKGQT